MLIHSRRFAVCHIIRKSICRHCYDWYRLCIRPLKRADIFCRFKSAHNRHHQIHQYNIKCAGFSLFKQLQCFFSVPCFCNNHAFILTDEICNFHVKHIIFRKQNFHAVKYNSFCFFILHCILFLLLIHLKRQSYYKCCAFPFFTGIINCSLHYLYNFFDNRKSQSRAAVNGLHHLFFLSERFKHMLLKIFTHTNSCILTYEFQHDSVKIRCTLRFCHRCRHRTTFFIILNGISHNI